MEQEIIDMLAFAGAFTILCSCIYILCVLRRNNKRKKIEPNVRMAVTFKEPVAEVIEESDDVLPIAEEVDDYLNANNV